MFSTIVLFCFFFILVKKDSLQYSFGFRIWSKMSFAWDGLKNYKRCDWSFFLFYWKSFLGYRILYLNAIKRQWKPDMVDLTHTKTIAKFILHSILLKTLLTIAKLITMNVRWFLLLTHWLRINTVGKPEAGSYWNIICISTYHRRSPTSSVFPCNHNLYPWFHSNNWLTI